MYWHTVWPWMTLKLFRNKTQKKSKRTWQLVLKLPFAGGKKNYLFCWISLQNYLFPTAALSKCFEVKPYSFKLKMSEGHEKKLIANFRVPCWYLKQPVDFCSTTRIFSDVLPLWFLYCPNQHVSRRNGFTGRNVKVILLLLLRCSSY